MVGDAISAASVSTVTPRAHANARAAGLTRIRMAGETAIVLAETDADRAMAFGLRYRAYHSQDYIKPNPDEIFRDRFDDRPDCRIILARRDGMLAASGRVNLYDPATPDDMPAGALFEDHVRPLADGVSRPGVAGRAVEITRLVRHPDFERDQRTVHAILVAVGYILLHDDVRIVYAAVRRNHIAFYRRLGFVQMTDPAPYPGLKFDTALIVAIKGVTDGVGDVRIFEALRSTDPPYAALFNGLETPVAW